jgi:hypothetical protein
VSGAGGRAGRLRAPLDVAAARLRAQPGRTALVALGVAAAAAMLLAVLGGSLVARDRAVQDAVAALPLSERTFRVDATALAAGGYAVADRQVREALAPLAPGTPVRAVFFRELRIAGTLVQLGGVDGLGNLVRLRSGRLPRSCVPARCEVLRIGPGPAVRLDEGDIHVVAVGVADVPRQALFGSAVETFAQSGQHPMLLLAAGSRTLDRLPAYDAYYRVYSWIAPLDPRRLHVWEIGRVLDRETAAQNRLGRESDSYRLSGPDSALVDARSRGRAAAQRMLLVGGEGSALLLGFALVAALGLRRGLANEARRLRQRGATRGQVWLAASAEIGITTAAGTLVGAAAGAAAVAAVADAAGLPAGAVLARTVGAGSGIAAAVWLAATLAVAGAARAGERPRGRRVGALDVAAAGAAAAAALGLSRGALDAETIASGGTRVLLLALPVLVSFAAAVVAVRALQPLTRLGERVARGGPLSLRLGLLALARAPARTTATAAFLLVSLGLALFASSWRATLDRGARDQAAFAVPLDFTAAEGSRLVLPLDAASLDRFERVVPGARAFPVLRRTADVAGVGSSVAGPVVLGVPPDAVRRLLWRPDYADAPAAAIAARLAAGGRAGRSAVPLPAGTRTATLNVTLRGVAVRLDLVLLDAGGRSVAVRLGEKGPGHWRLTARLPAGTRGVAGLEISLAAAEQLGFTHTEAGGDEAAPERGTAMLGALRAGGRAVVADWSRFVTRHGLQAGGGARPRLSYAFTEGQTMLLRLPQPADGRVLPVVASPEVARAAGPGGTLVLDFQDVRVPARIVEVARRFPGLSDADEGFVVADESRLAAVLDADAPGTASPGEVWLAVPEGEDGAAAAALRRPPFATLAVTSRRALQAQLASEPLARGISLSLLAAALVALALAVAGFWIALLSELGDERGELFDLEAQGVAPSLLRRQFRLRAGVLLAAGVAGGLALGLLLSRVVVSLVRLSGSTAPPDPPLRLDLPWPVALAALGAVVLALLAVVEATTRRAFRGDAPERASWSVE